MNYTVTGQTVDGSQITETVIAASPRHAVAKVHMSSYVPMVNTYQVDGGAQTINDMQAYLQCERFGL
jgi:hypothetical protein